METLTLSLLPRFMFWSTPTTQGKEQIKIPLSTSTTLMALLHGGHPLQTMAPIALMTASTTTATNKTERKVEPETG